MTGRSTIVAGSRIVLLSKTMTAACQLTLSSSASAQMLKISISSSRIRPGSRRMFNSSGSTAIMTKNTPLSSMYA